MTEAIRRVNATTRKAASPEFCRQQVRVREVGGGRGATNVLTAEGERVPDLPPYSFHRERLAVGSTKSRKR